jgi:hypothetical protein
MMLEAASVLPRRRQFCYNAAMVLESVALL